MRTSLAKAIQGRVQTETPSGQFLIGTVQNIEVTTGSTRIYVVSGRPMPMLDSVPAAAVVRGTRVLYWSGDQPVAFGPLVSD
jgi:hypothetical protein